MFPKVVVIISLLVTVFLMVSARPQPGVTRVRHIIHAPIKFRVIHHYKVQKIPVIVRKHVHYFKPQQEYQLPLEEDHSNDIQYEHVDEDGGHHRHIHHFYGDSHHEEEEAEEGHEGDYGSQHDYDDHQQSQEAEDYEYE